MPEVKDSIVINVPKEKFFEVIADFEKYPEFLPECKSIRIDSDEGDVTIVTQSLALMKTINLTTRMVLDPPNGLTWTLSRAT